MEQRRLGTSGLDVGVIGIGTWRTFDVPLSDKAGLETRRQVVENALAAGMNLFDSSPMYGTAEDVLAGALGDRRGEALIATKVWSRSIERGRAQIEHALALYGTVDIYQVHNLVEWQTYLPMLFRLKEGGKVRALGVTHYARSAFPDMMRIMETERIQCVQIPYNAADRAAERDLLPLAREADIGVIVMSPLGTGDLVKHSPSPQELQPLEAYGVRSWAQALLKWIVSDTRVTVTIPATSRPHRAAENAHAGDAPLLPEEQRERVAWLADRVVR
jgi:aryl-alcohol dehydrogenase-like predicted oxidoreductase